MDYTVLLIGLGIIIALVVLGKIFSFLTKALFVVIVIALIAAGIFFWANGSLNDTAKTSSINYTIKP